MTPQELKNSILQLAIQGKLVEQRPEEGTAKELYQRIQEEKKELIKAGKIKKEKSLPEITEDEIPFDIPESWKWVRITEIIDVRDGTHDTPKYVTIGVPLVTSKNLIDGNINFETAKLISTEDAQTINMRSAVDDGDILFAMIGTIGNPVLVKKDREFCIKNMALFKAIGQNLLHMEYFLLYLQNEQYVMKKKASGGVQSFVSLRFLRNYLLPLPPLAEQKRIVAKIEELLPYIDRYEKAWNRLEDLNKRFPADMQKSILQMAIQGKLVEQRPEEGTAEELYQQIQEEKQKLIKDGKIKKGKPLPEIAEDEKPYEIPANWTWVRFGDLGSYKKGPFGSAITKSMFVPKGNGAVKVYEQKNAIQKNASLGDYYISREYFETKMTGFEVLPGDIIVSCAGTIGETYVMPEQIEQGIINQALMRMKIFTPLYIPYFLVFFDFVLKKDARSSSKGSAIKNIPPFEILKNYLVPLPPLAEQKRIVAKLEEILPLCDKLK
ncbi:MAG: restriction endonuclease subunit S [Oscillospiraceae bacterium]|nr:restriction endonuclease subunit S [Oscillospiraceae bacterium]